MKGGHQQTNYVQTIIGVHELQGQMHAHNIHVHCECVTLLASGSGPTCRVGCVTFRPRFDPEILVTYMYFTSWCSLYNM